MNLYKDRLNSRTKSLREKFISKRSVSELSFKNLPSQPATNLQPSVLPVSCPPVSRSSLSRSKCHSGSGSFRDPRRPVPPLPTVDYHPNFQQKLITDESSYGSALDLTVVVPQASTSSSASIHHPFTGPSIIIGECAGPTHLPWQKDVGIQCELLMDYNLHQYAHGEKRQPPPTQLQFNPIQEAGKKNRPATTSLLNTAMEKVKNISDNNLPTTGFTSNTPGFSGRFWKSSNNVGQQQQQQQQQQQRSTASNFLTAASNSCRRTMSSTMTSTTNLMLVGPTRKILKRAASFHHGYGGSFHHRNRFTRDTGGGGSYSRLVQSTSSPSSPELCDSQQKGIDFPLVSKGTTKNCNGMDDRCVNKASNIDGSNDQQENIMANHPIVSSISVTAAASSDDLKNFPKTASEVDQDEADSLEIDNSFIEAKRLMAKKKKSDDEYDEDEPNNQELYNFDTKNRLLNISLRVHETTERMNDANVTGQSSGTALTKPFLLDLPTPGHNIGGENRDSGNPYVNLPSPNIQSEIQDVNPVLRKLSVLSRSPERALKTRSSTSSGSLASDRGRRGKSSSSSRRKKLIDSSNNDDDDDDDFLLFEKEMEMTSEPDEQELAKIQRRRRRALVPPKMITDQKFDDEIEATATTTKTGIKPEIFVEQNDKSSSNFNVPQIRTDENKEMNNDDICAQKSDDDNKSPKIGQQQQPCGSPDSSHSSSNNPGTFLGANLQQQSKNRRRSSMVVIPPMQICPGDLLVYSKVLTQREHLMEGNLGHSLLTEQDPRKSHKNAWSLLRLFDRSNNSRSKIEQIICGLEEYLMNLPPSNTFFDESMIRFKVGDYYDKTAIYLNRVIQGISWNEFRCKMEEKVQQQNQNNIETSSNLIHQTSLDSCTSSVIEQSATVGTDLREDTDQSRFSNGARFSSLESSFANTSLNCPICHRNLGPVPSRHAPPSSTHNGSNKSIGIQKGHSLERIPKKDQDELEQNENKTTFQRGNSLNTESEVESIVTEPDVSQHADGINVGQIQLGFNQLSTSSTKTAFCRECFQNFKREKRRHEALWELFQSELFFLTNHLLVLKNVFMEPLKSIQVEGYAMFAEPEVLFGNLDELCLVTYAFCKEFLNLLIRQEQASFNKMFGETCPLVRAMGSEVNVTAVLKKLYLKNNRLSSINQAFHRYTLNYINALQYLETLRRHLEFSEFEKWCNRDPRCKKLQLTDLLVTPVQHVMRVPILLKEIENKTSDPEEKRVIAKIIDHQEHSLRELDDKMRWLKNFERLLEIQRNIIWPPFMDMEPKIYVPDFLKSFLAKQPCERLIVSPRRQIVLEGPLMVMDSGKPIEMYLFLFDDLLLITRKKKGLGKKQSTLTERWVSNCGGRTSSFSSVIGPAAVNAPVSMATSNVATIANTAATIPVPGSSSTVDTSTVTGSYPHPDANSNSWTAESAVNHHHGSLTAASAAAIAAGSSGPACFKYVVYKQPLSLDRFYIHDVPHGTGDGSSEFGGGISVVGSGGGCGSNCGLKNGFSLVCLNRFQQVVMVHTFQASSEAIKNTWLYRLRSTCDRWKRQLQTNVTIRSDKNVDANSSTGGGDKTTPKPQAKNQTKTEASHRNQSNKIIVEADVINNETETTANRSHYDDKRSSNDNVLTSSGLEQTTQSLTYPN